MSSRAASRLAVLVGGAVVLVSCGRAHMSEGYGLSTKAALSAQAAPAQKHTNAVEGLDSQEASIIAASYRRSLAPEKQKIQDEPVIIVAPPDRNGTQKQQLAPSVPREQ